MYEYPSMEGFFCGKNMGKEQVATNDIRLYRPRGLGIVDTTLRDGTQSPLYADNNKHFLRTQDKLDITDALMAFGVRNIEVFSPFVSPREASDLQEIIALRDQRERETGIRTFILAHVRADPQDVEAAIKAGVDGLNMYFGTSKESQKNNHGKSLPEIIAKVRPLVEDLHDNHPGLMVRFSGEDAFRTGQADLFKVYDAVADFVVRFGTPDTVGVATPDKVARRVRALKKRYPNHSLEGHFHQDMGYALPNAVAAFNAGMEYIDTTLLGFAERSGINSMTALAFKLYAQDPRLLDEYDISLSYPANVTMADILNMQVPTTEPVSLTNRTHSAGVHTGAVLKGASSYEAHPLAQFGVSERRLLLGPLSGVHVVDYYLEHVLHMRIPYGTTDDQEAAERMRLMRQITTQFKAQVYDIQDDQTPTHILQEIAESHGLTAKPPPASHYENLHENGRHEQVIFDANQK